jgi:hypothetical protein
MQAHVWMTVTDESNVHDEYNTRLHEKHFHSPTPLIPFNL